MTTVEKYAGKVGEKLLTEAGVAFDPASVVLIITTIIQLFQACKPPVHPKRAAARMADPKFLDRVRLHRLIKTHFEGDHEALEAALLDVARDDLTVKDLTAMYAEVKKAEEPKIPEGEV